MNRPITILKPVRELDKNEMSAWYIYLRRFASNLCLDCSVLENPWDLELGNAEAFNDCSMVITSE